MDISRPKILSLYKKISGLIFRYFFVLVAIIVAILVFKRVLYHASMITLFQPNETLVMQKTRLIAEFNKFLRQNIKNNDTQIYILQGDLQTEDGFIKSVNNLISYKGFIVPKYFYIYSTLPVKPISYFSGGNYDTSELENFINTFVFTRKITVGKPFTRAQLPIAKTLIEDFNLSCLFEGKFSQRTCDHYLNDFLENFFVYTIPLDYEGFQKIFTTLSRDEEQKHTFCEGLSKYLLYANDYSDTIKNMFGSCGPSYEELFKRTTLFTQIQAGLDNQSFEKLSYKDPLLNAYKLLSYQQQIYQDFLINKIDIYKIGSYLDFVRELIQKNTIEQFYKDEIYRYNNKYLALTLEKFAYQSTNFTQNIGSSKITSLLTTITTLNEGEPMLGVPGLANQLQNPSLALQTITTSTGDIASITIAEQIKKRLSNLRYLNIEKQTITDNTIDVIGYLKFSSSNTNELIKAHIILEYRNDLLLVENIELQNRAEMNEVLKNLLVIQHFSLGELYSYIAKNLVFYGQEDTVTTIDADLCTDLSGTKNITLVGCDTTAIVVDQKNVRYTFTLKDGGISNISLSDKSLENNIKTSYSTIIAHSVSVADIIQAILAYVPQEQVREGTTNAILVFEKIQQYLSVKANDIADNNGNILVDLSLGGIPFIVKYSLQNHTLGPRYFKDILVNDKPYLIQNLSLSLDDDHQNSINTFVIDPLTAIKNADLTAWQNYQERLKKTTNN